MFQARCRITPLQRRGKSAAGSEVTTGTALQPDFGVRYAPPQPKGLDVSDRQIAERYTRAHMDQDWTVVAELAHRDIVASLPQSGETIRGLDNYLAILRNYPGGLGNAKLDIETTHETTETVNVVSSPIGLSSITISGSGDTFFAEGVAEYPDGAVYNVAAFIELRGGKVARETWYFAAPFDPPEWRASFVER